MPSVPPFPISDHCDGHRFYNPRYHENRSALQILKWRLTSRIAPWPKWVDLPAHPFDPAPPASGFTLTWINHASFLLRTPTLNLLIDPNYSTHLSPIPRIGPRRVHAPGVVFEKLPRIDAILLSHDHYDHLDLPTLRRIRAAGHDPLILAPLGNTPIIRRSGLTRIVELDWWQSHALETTTAQPTSDSPAPSTYSQPSTHASPLPITLTPARHWSNRLTSTRDARLWGGFYLKLPRRAPQPPLYLYFSGDTGYDSEMFHDIRRRLGHPDLALLPIGAYEPRWFMAAQHCNPAEAVQIHLDLAARRSIGMHWGCWQLTDEARDEPPRALAAALAARQLSTSFFITMQPGETLPLA